jgi:hypothetical protein
MAILAIFLFMFFVILLISFRIVNVNDRDDYLKEIEEIRKRRPLKKAKCPICDTEMYYKTNSTLPLLCKCPRCKEYITVRFDFIKE